MRKLSIFILILAAGFIIKTEASAQCDPGTFANVCIPKLSGGFNFLKAYKVDGEGGNKTKVEYSYVFAKGTQYMINLCTGNGDADGVVVTLYDSNRNKKVSNVYEGEYLSAIQYLCNATGIYYITYTFENSSQYCGGSALGFKR